MADLNSPLNSDAFRGIDIHIRRYMEKLNFQVFDPTCPFGGSRTLNPVLSHLPNQGLPGPLIIDLKLGE